VSLPKGAIWQALRAKALETIPLGTPHFYRPPRTLAQGQAEGAYVITGASRKQFTIVAPSIEVAGALIGEAAFLLDHAAEHQAHIWGQLRCEEWSSPSWQITTFYYWAFFLVSATTRMLGDTVWFVDPDVAAELSKLAPGGAPRLGSGAFSFVCRPTANVAAHEIVLRKLNGRVHEQVWRSWFATVKTLLDKLPSGSSDPLEERLFRAQLRAANVLRPDWPSALRNLVNYRPGFGYAAVRREQMVERFAYLSTDSPDRFQDVVSRLESNVVALSTSSLRDQPKLASRVLVDLAFVLHAIARELQYEIVDRHSLDPRWRTARRNFLRDRGLAKGGEWPC
jgi:hypothetical protein